MRALVCLAMLAFTACQDKTAASGAAANPTTDEQKTLYALGLSIGRNLSVFGLTAEELAYVRAGLDASVLGQKPAVELQQWGPKINVLARQRAEARTAKEKEKAKSYLDAAAKEDGAVREPSGLIYKSIKEGTGAQPAATDVVKVHYRGTLTDGTEFDSSYARSEPTEFPLNRVIPCWTQGVQKMKIGGKAKLVCPSDIAYGDGGQPPSIPGGAVLTFEVELLEVKKAPDAPAAPSPTINP